MSPPEVFTKIRILYKLIFNIVRNLCLLGFSIKCLPLEQFLPQFLNLVKDSAFAIKTLIRIPVASILSLEFIKMEYLNNYLKDLIQNSYHAFHL
jgi:hypothetical protein